MECDPYFSLSNISGSSYESEVAQSNLCVSNRLKLAVYILGMFFFFLLFLVAFSALVRDIRRGAQTYRKLFLLGMALACLAEVLAYTVFLAGVDHRARFILTPIPYMMSTYAAKELIDAWYEAVTQISAFQEHHNKGFYKKYTAMVSAISWGCIFGLVVLWGALPMIFVDDPFAMNALYAGMMFYLGLCGLTQTAMFHVAVIKLKRLYQTGSEFATGNASVDDVLAKLTKSKKLCYNVFYPGSFPLLLFPIWVFVTQTETNPGLEGVFYWHFFALGLTKFQPFCMMLYLILRVVRRNGDTTISSLQGSSNAEKRVSTAVTKEKDPKSFPSFSVEELTVDSSI